MDENKYVEAIEKLNKEYMELFNSNDYRKIRSLKKLNSVLKKLDFKFIVKDYVLRKRYKKLEKTMKFNDNSGFDINVIDTQSYKEIINKKIVVYTCIIGEYDIIREPLYIDEYIDYYIITNLNIDLSNSIWRKREIPSKNFQRVNHDPVLTNRYVKMHPKEMFPEYDYSIYIDGCVRIISDIKPFLSQTKKTTGIAMHRHSARNSLFDEASVCIVMQKGNVKYLKNQVEKYKQEEMPKKFGLLEATLIAVDLNNDNCMKILETWWEEFIHSKSMRDQIALPYVLWKTGYTIEDIGNLGNNIYKNYKLQIKRHGY